MSKGGKLTDATVLVTGGAGFIGSNFVHRCLTEGAAVRVLDCHLAGSGFNPTNLEDLRGEIELLEGDVRDQKLVSKALDGIDLVLHAAAQTSHTNSMEHALVTLDVNCRGTLHLLEAIRNSDSKPKLVHVGTTTQLGPMIQEPIDETHPEFPRDIYSATMVGSEKLVLIYANAYGLRTTVIRLPNTYGPRAAIHSPDLGFVNYFIGLGLQKRPLTIYGDGRQLRSLLYIEDAIEALLLAATAPEADGQVLFASSDRVYSVGEIAEAITHRIGGRVSYVDWPEERKAIEVGSAIIDSSKIQRMLGWKPSVELAEGLDETREYYQRRLASYLRENS